MLDCSTARKIAERAVDQSLGIHASYMRELQYGWYFPYEETEEPMAGSNGVIVNKATHSAAGFRWNEIWRCMTSATSFIVMTLWFFKSITWSQRSMFFSS
jgi:hypothetical protein